jgi:hypothetical protein
MERLSASARGWHTIQLAVLGFIGICGVLRSAAMSTPRAVQVVAAVLAIASLAVACVALIQVGRVAYPIDDASNGGGDRHDVVQARRQLRGGIRLTVVALVLIVIASLSGWWPSKATTSSKAGATLGRGRPPALEVRSALLATGGGVPVRDSGSVRGATAHPPQPPLQVR